MSVLPALRVCESAVATTSPAGAGGTACDVEADFMRDFEAAAGAGADFVAEPRDFEATKR